MTARVADALNAALGTLLAEDPTLYLLGEDITDPYGGAFKVTRGLSTRFPDRVLGTPISESAIVGVANGLALAGDKAIVEIMFADFALLAFDQIVNVAAKSTAMFGRPVPMPLIVRCPTGGNRGYGPTHSQSPQKHFLGVPGLDVHELSPFHSPLPALRSMLGSGRPAVLFEDKVLYGRPLGVPRLFALREDTVVIDGAPCDDYLIVAPGGLAHRALEAMETLLRRYELCGALHVPTRLYPWDPAPVLRHPARRILVVDDGPPGASWATEVAYRLRDCGRPVRVLHAADTVVPTAAHLERSVLVQAATIVGALR
ncbi:alpha-ketoacid dehydrogenase subunit beta [Dactylosporangium vinaceum]|uniref:Alpha-ketoacid dehydrogenase subunit beta n=1 Tax=Dactylosporangium vinaceum TaxID=53362 RepID=A0ABV5MST0_9ACTN|nr:transketolase C-terminal domain-containing protein [Dactylosporangium vinaceum]UAB97683.1 alpha-ketoacid dehydrogenase subunit beta [Dactylosporangium vinaceum]